MKNRYFSKWLLFVVILSTTFSFADEGAQNDFEKIKSLAGKWRGSGPEGKSVTLDFEIVSNGSAVLERMQSENEPGMITMYHLDGEYLMMTHYCSAKNQPRMRAAGDNDVENDIRFLLLDVTNLANSTDGHMQKLVMSFKDHDHLVTRWTFVKDGKEMAAPFEFERAKMNGK